MACEKDLDLVAYVKGEMAPSEAEAVRLHLPTCVDCQEELGSVEELLGGIGSMPSVAPPEDFAARVTRALGADAGYVKLAKETKRKEREETIRQHGWWAWAGKSMKDRMRSAPGWVAAAAVYLITFGALAWVLLKDYKPGTVTPDSNRSVVAPPKHDGDAENPPATVAKLPFVESRTSATARAQVTPEAAKAIERGLAWLVAGQGKDGSWGAGSVQATAVAALALLGDAQRGEPTKRAMAWLRGKQRKSGAFDEDLQTHALATVALAESIAFALADKVETAEAQKSLESALAFSRSAQLADGSWGPLTATARNVESLRLGAQLGAHGCQVPLERTQAYIPEAQMVTSVEEEATWLLTYLRTGARSDLKLDESKREFLLNHLPNATEPAIGAWWLATDAMQLEGEAKSWQPALDTALLTTQSPDGSWGTPASESDTAAAILALEAPYRLPAPVQTK